MAAPMDLRGRVVIVDAGATSTLGRIRQGLAAIGQQGRANATVMGPGGVTANVFRSMAGDVSRLQTAMVGLRNNMVLSGAMVAGIIAQTRGFNEAKFGYGFARITEFIRDGRLDIAAWRGEMDKAALSAREVGRNLGLAPERTMQAREEVQKLGFKQAEADAVYNAALGLHMSEPDALSSGDSAKYIGAVLRAYRKQIDERATKSGVDPSDPKFIDMVTKELAAKAAVAGAESALGPADIVEGMRQFAPQWASMGIDYETALAALAHGSNYGFRAAEMGTALKSMVTKTLNPTATGLAILNARGIDRSQFYTTAAVEPGKAANRLNSLLGGALSSGQGGKDRMATIREMLDTAYASGEVTSPQFQEALTQEVLRMLPSGYEGKSDDVMQAVGNATMSAQGGVKLPEMIKAMRDSGMGVGDIAQVLEGRHVARYTPMFQFYEQFISMIDKLKSTDGSTLDAIKEGRKDSAAGKTDALIGAWQQLMTSMESAGGVIDTLKVGLTALFNAMSQMSPVMQGLTIALVGLGTAGAGIAVLRGAIGLVSGVLARAAGMAVLAGGAAATGAATGAAGAAAGIGAGIGGAAMAGAAALRTGLTFVPGWGWVAAAALTAGMGAYSYYQSQSGGGASLPAAGTLGGEGGPADGIASGSVGADIERLRAEAAQAAATVRAAMSELSGAVTQSAAELAAAARSAAAGIRSASGGGRVSLNTGPAMGATPVSP